MCINVGSVRKVKPAQRISNVAFPINKIEPFVKSAAASELVIGNITSLTEDPDAICDTILMQYGILTVHIVRSYIFFVRFAQRLSPNAFSIVRSS
jgi:hypothetical protein